MTPHEKAVSAINARLERLQANLRDAETETERQFLFQSLVVTIGVAEGFNDYIKGVGKYAQRRHGELKQTNEALSAQHADLLNAGKALLEKLKADPTDSGVRQEIERAQQSMVAIQKALRRGANTLQREVAPGLALIDQMAENVRRLAATEERDSLKRVLKTCVGQVRALYAAQPALPAKDIIHAEAWEKAIVAEIGQAAGMHDAYARAAFHAALALELMAMAVSENPPRTAEEATERANVSTAARLKEITARFSAA